MKLSPRLQAVADLVPNCQCIADIGTDHAYLPIYLLKTKRIQKAIASDIHKGPASRAMNHLHNENLLSQAKVKIGAGLSILNNESVNGVIMAGMGGLMIQSIMKDSPQICSRISWFILQPQNHIPELRLWLQQNHYKIAKELLAQEAERFYEILLVIHGEMKGFSLFDAEIGVTNSRYEDPLFVGYLKKIIKKKALIIENIPMDTKNAQNLKKREKALDDKKRLEEILWKFT